MNIEVLPTQTESSKRCPHFRPLTNNNNFSFVKPSLKCWLCLKVFEYDNGRMDAVKSGGHMLQYEHS